MKHAALGFRAHSGWTSLVAISLEEGSPLVLLRERPHLVKTFTYEFRQPYHTAAKRAPAEAHGFISRLRVEARGLSYRVVHSVQMNLQKQGYELKCCSLLLASGKPLPGLPKILASHALIHAADGELFREALLHASKRCGVELFTAKESELLARAVRDLHLQPNELRRPPRASEWLWLDSRPVPGSGSILSLCIPEKVNSTYTAGVWRRRLKEFLRSLFAF